MLTDNPVLVRKLYPTPALCCAQRKAEKKIPTEEDFVRANINSFGNEIGSITNRITSMYEVRQSFDKNSEEYKVLSYRIQCGQQHQQDTIDRAKGIVSKPMAKSWYDWHAVNKIEDEDKKSLYKRIIADKKPYFMRYIYPDLNREYITYIKNANKNSIRKFNVPIDELLQKKYSELSEGELQFLKYYKLSMPVGTNPCVMNLICYKFEEEFHNLIRRFNESSTFDYRVMKSDAVYSKYQFDMIKKLFDEYNKRLRKFKANSKAERMDTCDSLQALTDMEMDFRKECEAVCPNQYALCNIVLDIAYTRSATKKFAWAMCGDVIVENLLKANNYIIEYPALADDGFNYAGNKYEMRQIELEEFNDDSIK